MNDPRWFCYACQQWLHERDTHTRSGPPLWVCYLCGEDFGDHSTVASGDCVACGHVVCERHFADYDESDCAVTCARCATQHPGRAATVGRHFHVGSNVPGYLPEREVECFDDAEYALDRIAQLIEQDLTDDWPDEAFAYAEVESLRLRSRGDLKRDALRRLTVSPSPAWSTSFDTGAAMPTSYWIDGMPAGQPRSTCDLAASDSPLKPTQDPSPTTDPNPLNEEKLMSSTLPGTPTPSPVEPVTVWCAASYYADRGQYAFNFRVPVTNTRFTIYASNQDSYQVGESYAMILAAPDAMPLPLNVDDIEFLRHCLTTTAQRWREAIAETDAGADRAPREHAPQPGHLNAEPTPAGYQSLGRLFRDELGRVDQLTARLGEFSRVADLGRDGDRP